MRILLTGASGFIGRHLLDALLDAGHHVVCAGRRAPARVHPHCTFVAADFTRDTSPAVWLGRLAGIDAVINTVGIFRESGQQTFARLHTETPSALFTACVQAGTVRFVLQLSALGADALATSAYHVSKKAADDTLASLPLRSAIVQPSLIYGRDGASAGLLRMLASLPLCPRFGPAPQLVQPIHIDDAVAAMAALLHELDTPDKDNDDNYDMRTPRRIALVGPHALPFSEYLAALRHAMGMGKLRLLPLPRWCARLAAAMAGRVPGSLFSPDALRMLERGNTADPGATTHLLGQAPRPVARFIDDAAGARLQARLAWLLPLLRLSIAAVWIITAMVSAGLYPVQHSYALLERSGIPPALAPLMLGGAVGVDLLLGLGTLFLRGKRWLWGLQLALIGFYTLVIAWKLPEFLLHPYGPLTKNLPMLAAIWLLYELEDDKQ